MSGEKFLVFSGPCVIESEDFVLEVASKLKSEFSEFSTKVDFVFKASFDKANRSSIKSFRGPGMEAGLKILARVKKELNLKIVTDFHHAEQAMSVAEVADYLQVPAFLCRQTDMIEAGALACKKFNRTLKVKKGQFLSPYEAKNIVDKASTILPKNQILLTERGSSFGYNNLIVDMASFEIMKSFGVRTIHDATHCVQQPGGLGHQTGGKREQILTLAKAAVAAGADGVFMEVHPFPDQALSDSATSLPLNKAKIILKQLLAIHEVSKEVTTL